MENKEAYSRVQTLEKEIYAFQMRLREVEAREQNCIAEIHTLERHIDHLTHQLELVNVSLKESRDEKEAILHDMNSQRNLSYNLEITT